MPVALDVRQNWLFYAPMLGPASGLSWGDTGLKEIPRKIRRLGIMKIGQITAGVSLRYLFQSGRPKFFFNTEGSYSFSLWLQLFLLFVARIHVTHIYLLCCACVFAGYSVFVCVVLTGAGAGVDRF